MSLMLNRLILMLSVLILVVLAAIGGYFLGTQNGQKSQIVYQPKEVNSLQKSLGSGVVAQHATYEGTLIAVNDDKVTVQGNDGQKNSFKLDPKFIAVSDQKNASSSAKESNSAILQSLVGQKVALELALNNSDYLVKIISKI
jgi:preprotein translocase subunit YajC